MPSNTISDPYIQVDRVSNLITQELIYDSDDLFWKQDLTEIVVILHSLTWFQIATVHLAVHNLRNVSIWNSSTTLESTSNAPTASNNVK